jgi:hypothetical protein
VDAIVRAVVSISVAAADNPLTSADTSASKRRVSSSRRWARCTFGCVLERLLTGEFPVFYQLEAEYLHGIRELPHLVASIEKWHSDVCLTLGQGACHLCHAREWRSHPSRYDPERSEASYHADAKDQEHHHQGARALRRGLRRQVEGGLSCRLAQPQHGIDRGCGG